MPLQQKIFKLVVLFIIVSSANTFAQDNSPLSRFGVGDLVPTSHQVLRAMGGVNTAIGSATGEGFFINNANPASYPYLSARKANKIIGRTILDIGVDYGKHTLKSSTPNSKYASNSLIFSYFQVGIPLDTPQRWGLVFGLKPYSNISYNVVSRTKVFGTDSLLRQFEGSGGSYKGFVGTGYRIGGFSFGVNTGYIFGKKNFATRNGFINDSVLFYPANFETKTNFSNVFFETGVLYTHNFNETNNLTLGFNYTFANKLKATQDVIKETYRIDQNTGSIDSLERFVYLTNNKGNLSIPENYSIGLTYHKTLSNDVKKLDASYLISAQYESQKLSNYDFYGSSEGLVNSSTFRIGGFYLNPFSKSKLLSSMTYRLGYYNTKNANGLKNVNQSAVTFGFGLPLSKPDYYSNQVSFLNVSFEVGSRKGLTNFKENFLKIGVGFSLTDVWFQKRKYN
jgi:hypothetical protein